MNDSANGTGGVSFIKLNPKGAGTMIPTDLRYNCKSQLDLKRLAMLV